MFVFVFILMVWVYGYDGSFLWFFFCRVWDNKIRSGGGFSFDDLNEDFIF